MSTAAPKSSLLQRAGVKTPQERAKTNPVKFALILTQLALLLVVVKLYGVEEHSTMFYRLTLACVLGFVVHYFTPFTYKKHAFLAVSVLGAAFVLWPDDPRKAPIDKAINVASVLGVTGILSLVFYGVLRLPIKFIARVAILVGIGAALYLARRDGMILPNVLGFKDAEGNILPGELFPSTYWAIVGSIFMFRLALYAFEVRVAKKPEKLIDYLSYMLVLPNFYFAFIFPVIDYSTFKKSHYAEDIHVVAQRGVLWISRGIVQLLLLNVVRHHFQVAGTEVHDFWSLWQFMIGAYLMYLRVSGQFHMIVGMLLLFGYSLPETHRRYYLAHSFTDFWRRINIYWKDYMVKLIFYPVYFRLRKKNEKAALVIGTVCVFVATTVLHSYQFFWVRGSFKLTQTDLMFWGVLGGVVIVNMLWEQRPGAKKKKPTEQKGPAFWAVRSLQVVAMFLTMSVLWSMWTTPELLVWIDTVRAGLGGGGKP